MGLFWKEESNRMVDAYLEQVKKSKNKLSKKSGVLLDLLIRRMETNESGADDYFYSLIIKGDLYRIDQLFENERHEVLVHLLGEAYADKYISWLKKLPYIPYTYGYYRRPVRSEKAEFHYNKALNHLKDFFAIVASGLSLEIILEGGQTDDQHTFIKDIEYHHLLSVEIDNGNTSVIQKVKDIICSENNANGIITYSLLQGIVSAGNTELYELEGKLLLAARLQEGLRQSIVETMDSGKPEAFIYLFNIIRENDLQRYSSVKRAVGVWTGLLTEAHADRINLKIIEIIHRVLTDASYADSCLQSKDTVEVFLALWSKGFFRVEDIGELASVILNEGVKHKIQVLFYYLEATQNRSLQIQFAKRAIEKYNDDPAIIAAYINSYLTEVTFGNYYHKKVRMTDYYGSQEEANRHYGILKNMLDHVKEKQSFSPFIFPWYSTELSKQMIADKMAAVVYVTRDGELLDDMCEYYGRLSIYARSNLISELMNPPVSALQKETLVKALGDRAESPRDNAFRILDEMQIENDLYGYIEELLKYKTGDMRQHAIKLLLKQTPQQLSGSIERLLSDASTEKRLGGLDLLLSIRGNQKYARVYEQSLVWLDQIKDPTEKERLLINQLSGLAVEKTIYKKENGFGLFDPEEKISLPVIKPDHDFDLKKTFSIIYDSSFIQKLFSKIQSKPLPIFEKLNNLVAEHAQYEYTTKYGVTCLLGDTFAEIIDSGCTGEKIECYPLPDVWKDFYRQEIGDFKVMLQLVFILSSTWDKGKNYGVYQFMGKEFMNDIIKFYGFDLYDLKNKLEKLPYYPTMNTIIHQLARTYWDVDYANNVSKNLLASFFPLLNKKSTRKVFTYDSYNIRESRTVFIYQHNSINYWMSDNFFDRRQDEAFKELFLLRYQYYVISGYLDTDPPASFPKGHLSIFDFGKAYTMGIIPESELIKELTVRINAQDSIHLASSFLFDKLTVWQQNSLKEYKDNDLTGLKEVMQKVTRRILDIELNRGDSATEVSHLALKLEHVEGAGVLVDILKAMGKDTFGRADYYYNSSYTKKEVLSKLLRCCYPLETDTAETLSDLVKGTDITEKRLVEAAMYAPQWLDIVEKCIGWEGLSSAAYYFHAHINEWCDDKKKAIIARYTPIDPEDLRLGAFDIDWFKEAYKEIGAKRFEVVYEAAKYISSGSGHTRARKYADAVNGKMKAREVKAQVMEKRNKDLLMSYCLIPLNKRSKKDILERYLYLQQFLKESKAFGSQRQESEKKAVEIGFQNLARNAGYTDETRLIWSMETELIKDMEPYFTPKEEEGVGVYIEIDQEGKSDIKYVKAGKPLISIPSRLRKNAYMEELRGINKKLKQQYSRSRTMLEQAMEDRTPFMVNELQGLTANPVVWPLLSHLVFITAERITGFYSDGSLISPDGEITGLEKEAVLYIAHPFDLYEKNVWQRYQEYLFETGLRQPFKQVFRELYLKTDEEKPMTRSSRYAGHQVQANKTVALLKGRRWVANYEEGLQKIYYKDNIVANIYALADWFSPADIESPTLEWVAFYERKSYEPIPISEVPDVIFSEVMRDVDLAVSVAHAGGVDPEASHSTVEMRRAIVEYTLPLFKLSNVRLNGTFAFIDGKTGNYSIHLGSGMIHKEAKGAVAVLPVHSQHRGRLFLPFVDEDPKTAEIMSKIILFAEDSKIKDPFILKQIS